MIKKQYSPEHKMQIIKEPWRLGLYLQPGADLNAKILVFNEGKKKALVAVTLKTSTFSHSERTSAKF